MKLLLTVIPILNLCMLCAQTNDVRGKTTFCNKIVWISSKHIYALDQRSSESIVISNHAEQYKSTFHEVKSVHLKDVLRDISFAENLPKEFSNYYIVCTARDNYKVVFSWDELFNTNVDDGLIQV